jgi:hypothetical protein
MRPRSMRRLAPDTLAAKPASSAESGIAAPFAVGVTLRLMRFLSSLRVRLILVLLFVALAPLVTLLVVLKARVEQSVERSALATIAAIAEGKAAQLDALGRERMRQVASIASGVAFIDAVESLSAAYRADGSRDDAAIATALERFRPRSESWTKTNDIDLLLLADRTGRVVYASADSPLLHGEMLSGGAASSPLARALAKARSTKAPALTRPDIAAEGVRPNTDIVGPLLRDNEIVGFAIVAIDPADIDRIVTDYTGLGATGETVCATMSQGDIVLTTPSRADRNAAYTLRAPMGSDTWKNLQGSVYGSPSRGRGVDTANEPALGAWTRVESLGWAIGVTKRLDEVFSEAVAQERAILMIAAAAAIPVIVIALLIARSIARPIHRAAEASRRLAVGDLAGDIRPIGSGEPRALLVTMREAPQRTPFARPRTSRTRSRGSSVHRAPRSRRPSVRSPRPSRNSTTRCRRSPTRCGTPPARRRMGGSPLPGFPTRCSPSAPVPRASPRGSMPSARTQNGSAAWSPAWRRSRTRRISCR